jgi:hypothetical protein
VAPLHSLLVHKHIFVHASYTLGFILLMKISSTIPLGRAASTFAQADCESSAQAVASLQQQMSASQEEVTMRRAAAVAAAASVEQLEEQLTGLKADLRGQKQQVGGGGGLRLETNAHMNELARYSKGRSFEFFCQNVCIEALWLAFHAHGLPNFVVGLLRDSFVLTLHCSGFCCQS